MSIRILSTSIISVYSVACVDMSEVLHKGLLHSGQILNRLCLEREMKSVATETTENGLQRDIADFTRDCIQHVNDDRNHDSVDSGPCKVGNFRLPLCPALAIPKTLRNVTITISCSRIYRCSFFTRKTYEDSSGWRMGCSFVTDKPVITVAASFISRLLCRTAQRRITPNSAHSLVANLFPRLGYG